MRLALHLASDLCPQRSLPSGLHYTMVKTSTFNGVRLPSILLREPDGAIHLVREFGYADFKGRLS